jgi:hypothetical protein
MPRRKIMPRISFERFKEVLTLLKSSKPMEKNELDFGAIKAAIHSSEVKTKSKKQKVVDK